MNFKQLCTEFIRQAGISGGTTFQTVDSVQGEHARVVSWVRAANRDIQGLYFDWKFLWASHSFQTSDGTKTYTAPSNLHYWDRSSFRVDDVAIEAMEYELWDKPATEPSGKPWKALIMPDNGLKMTPIPDGAYTVEADYYKTPQELTANTDIPWLPETFHDLIWMRALLKYAFYEAAPEAVERARTEYPERLRALESHQLPNRHRYQLAYDPDPVVVVPE